MEIRIRTILINKQMRMEQKWEEIRTTLYSVYGRIDIRTTLYSIHGRIEIRTVHG